VATWLLFCVAVLAGVGDGRAFRLVIDPAMAALMTVVSVAALGARARRAAAPMPRHDWFWILTAHIVYFGLEILHVPLLEALVAWRLDAFDAHVGFMLADVAVYCMLAWGMLQPAAASPLAARGLETA
jgi:hypothetical protein